MFDKAKEFLIEFFLKRGIKHAVAAGVSWVAGVLVSPKIQGLLANWGLGATVDPGIFPVFHFTLDTATLTTAIVGVITVSGAGIFGMLIHWIDHKNQNVIPAS